MKNWKSKCRRLSVLLLALAFICNTVDLSALSVFAKTVEADTIYKVEVDIDQGAPGSYLRYFPSKTSIKAYVNDTSGSIKVDGNYNSYTYGDAEYRLWLPSGKEYTNLLGIQRSGDGTKVGYNSVYTIAVEMKPVVDSVTYQFADAGQLEVYIEGNRIPAEQIAYQEDGSLLVQNYQCKPTAKAKLQKVSAIKNVRGLAVGSTLEFIETQLPQYAVIQTEDTEITQAPVTWDMEGVSGYDYRDYSKDQTFTVEGVIHIPDSVDVSSGQITLGNGVEASDVASEYKTKISVTVSSTNTLRGINIGTEPLQADASGKWSVDGGRHVYYGTYDNRPMAFRILGRGSAENPVSSATQSVEKSLDSGVNNYKGEYLLLDAEESLYTGYFHYGNDGNEKYSNWGGSDVYRKLNGSDFLNSSFSKIEQEQILNTRLKEHSLSYNGADYDVPASIRTAVDSYDAECIDNKMYLLSLQEAVDLYDIAKPDIAKGETGDMKRWLRSAQKKNLNRSVICLKRDRSYIQPTYGTANYAEYGVSPAFSLDLTEVLFTQAEAVNKSEVLRSTTKPLDGSSDRKWELTLKDTQKSVSVTSGKNATGTVRGRVTVPYTYSDSNTQNPVNQISVMITNNDYDADGAAVMYYGKLDTGASLNQTGTGTFTLPAGLSIDGWESVYQVYLIPECVTETGYTDYAGIPVKLARPDVMQAYEPETSIMVSGEYGAALSECTISGKMVDSTDRTKEVSGKYEFDESENASAVYGCSEDKKVLVKFTPNNSSYATDVFEAVLAITPKPVTVTIDDKERCYKEANPSLTARVTAGELVNGDTLDAVAELSTAAEAASPVQAAGYPITGIGINANYNVIFIPGTLMVTPADAHIFLESGKETYEKTYGDDAFELEGITEDNDDTDELVYLVSQGSDVVSVSGGMVTILKAGTAQITLSMPASANYKAADEKIITIHAAKKAGQTQMELDRSYLFTGGQSDCINLGELFPQDCGVITGTVRTDGDIRYEKTPALTDGKLAYTTARGAAGNKGTIYVTAGMDNYEDVLIQINITLTEKSVVLQDGAQVSLQRKELVFGQELSALTFKEAVFVDTETKEPVSGTLTWKNPQFMPDMDITEAEWIFTPDKEEYKVCTGEAAISVQRAVPYVEEIPAVGARIYQPSVALKDEDLTGGLVKGADGAVLAGSWKWQKADEVPSVNNTGYVAVFHPEDTIHYEEVTKVIPVKVSKAKMNIGIVTAREVADTRKVPEDLLSREHGEPQGTLTLDEEKLDYGTNTYHWTFTPEDSVNYEVLTGTVQVTVSDTTAPAVSYRVGTDGWKKFVNTITFGLFCKDYKTIEIEYQDLAGEESGSGIAKKQYYIAKEEIKDISTVSWKDYEGTLELNAAGTYFIYVRAEDQAGNVTVQNSEGIVIYTESVLTADRISYTYRENAQRSILVSLNGNTLEKITDSDGNALAFDAYRLDADGTLTFGAEYLDSLNAGSHHYRMYMNPQGVKTEQISVDYSFDILVNAAPVTVSGVTAKDRVYDATNRAELVQAALEGIREGDEVYVKLDGLDGIISDSRAGEYTVISLPELSLAGADAANYRLIQPAEAVALTDKLTIARKKVKEAEPLERAYAYYKENTESISLTELLPQDCGAVIYHSPAVSGAAAGIEGVSVENGTLYYTVKAGAEDIAGTAATLEVSVSSDNYEDILLVVRIIRTACEHSYSSLVTKQPTTGQEGIMTYTCTLCGHSYTEPIAKLEETPASTKPEDENKSSEAPASTKPEDENKSSETPASAKPEDENKSSEAPASTKPEDENKSSEAPAGMKPDAGTPYISQSYEVSGWNAIRIRIEHAAAGEVLTVEMNGTQIVPKSVFDSMKNRDVTVVFAMDNRISWKVAGRDITDAPGDIDFGVTIGEAAGRNIPANLISKLAGERSTVNLTLAYDGAFGFTATLALPVGAVHVQHYANLFYYNPQEGTLSFAGAGKITEGGSVELQFSHASDYVIVIDEGMMNQTQEGQQVTRAAKTGDTLQKNIWMQICLIAATLLLLAGGICNMSFMRRRDR